MWQSRSPQARAPVTRRVTLTAIFAIAIVGTTDALAAFPQLARCTVLASEPGKAAALQTLAQAKMRAALRDPESARFGSATHVRAVCNEGAHDIVCGSVNAKNGFGGYTGAQGFAFITSGDEYAIALESGDERELRALQDAYGLCLKALQSRSK